MTRPSRSMSAAAALLALLFNLVGATPATPTHDQVPNIVHSKLEPALEALAFEADSDPDEPIRVIVQSRGAAVRVDETITGVGGSISRELPLVQGYVADVPRRALAAVAYDEDTIQVSLDRVTFSLQTDRYDENLIRVTTGAENVVGRSGLNGDKSTADYVRQLPSGPNGTGVTIAILDSGIYTGDAFHEDLSSLDDAASSRVLVHRNFVAAETERGETSHGFDPYGHGTHVAGVAAGSGRECLENRGVGNFYAGMAFNANLIDLRVIGKGGVGRISDTIAAIDWMIANRSRFNIRIANLSLGAAVTQSYKNDPLCQAVERAVNSGIVCVVAAGNLGKDAEGKAVYGGILSPANDPLVITVGAVNPRGTAVRSDDDIASYSSHGPTLVDFVCKPDLVAPGTLVRSIAANQNQLTTSNGLTVYAQNGQDVYMWLSGTSVAAPVVAGAVALMLETNPGLTPAMVKSILQFTAQPLPSLSEMDPLLRVLHEGAGNLNAEAAVRVSQAIVRDAGTQPNGVVLSDYLQSGAILSDIAGEIVPWGDRIVYSSGLAYLYRNERLSVIKTAGCQVAPGFQLFDGFVAVNGSVLADSPKAQEVRLDGSRLVINAKLSTESKVGTNAWLWNRASKLLSNPAELKPIWAENLVDQSIIVLGAILSDGAVLSDHAALERVMAWGDDAPGLEITRIKSAKHPLFPRGRKIKR